MNFYNRRSNSDTRPAGPSSQVARDEPFEAASEVFIPDRVNDRIEQRVGVAEPHDDAGHGVRDLTLFAEGQGRGEEEKRKPAENETADDQAEHARRIAHASILTLSVGDEIPRLLLLMAGTGGFDGWRRNGRDSDDGQVQPAVPAASDDAVSCLTFPVIGRALDSSPQSRLAAVGPT